MAQIFDAPSKAILRSQIAEHIAETDKNASNIMYTMHFYAGTHKKWLRDRTDNAISNGIPVFVSECAGMEANGDGPLDTNEWNAFVEWMEASKISWVAWSVSDKNETCSMLLPRASSNGDNHSTNKFNTLINKTQKL